MALPEPRPGLVFRHDDLWSREAAFDRDQGKERPACLIAASDPATKPRFVIIRPIRHRPSSGETVGIEIPPRVRQAVGLDDKRCWVVVSEHNVDEWPNGGLAPLLGRPGVFSYGFIRLRCLPESGHDFWRWLSKGVTPLFSGSLCELRAAAKPDGRGAVPARRPMMCDDRNRCAGAGGDVACGRLRLVITPGYAVTSGERL